MDDLGETEGVCRSRRIGGGRVRELLLFECLYLPEKLWLRKEDGDSEGSELERKGIDDQYFMEP